MKKVLFTLSAIAVSGFMFSACDETVNADACDDLCAGQTPVCHVDDITGAGMCGPDCKEVGLVFDHKTALCVTPFVGECKKDNDCEGDYKCDTEQGKCVPKGVSAPEYKYVRIDDLSDASKATGEDPGADIDAVVLVKSGSKEQIYAVAHHGYKRGDGKSSVDDKTKAFDPDAIIGAPDSFVDYPDSAKCNYYKENPKTNPAKEYTFVSLGGQAKDGTSGYIIVEMGGKIEVNDQLDVLELGNCKLANTSTSDGVKAVAEEIEVHISISAEFGGDWVSIGTGTGVVSNTITATHLK